MNKVVRGGWRWVMGLLVVVFLFQSTSVRAITLLDPVQGKKEARVLVDRLLSLQVDGDSTNYGTLKIIPKDRSKRVEMPVQFEVRVTTTNWQSIYRASFTNRTEELLILHSPGQEDEYFYHSNAYDTIHDHVPLLGDVPWIGHMYRSDKISGDQKMTAFAGSDFSSFDLGLGFLHWPGQRILKKEIKRSCGCSVLESLNPDPNSKGYSRVLTWIDNDSLGVVQAEAYDAKGELLKEFLPKSVTKVNGQWQVEEIEMDNDQTDSRTLIQFDLSH